MYETKIVFNGYKDRYELYGIGCRIFFGTLVFQMLGVIRLNELKNPIFVQRPNIVSIGADVIKLVSDKMQQIKKNGFYGSDV